LNIEIIDVTTWQLDEQSGIFPVGARDKQMLWSPNEVNNGIKPSWPYLFKESIDRYPDQYWTEVIAYIVGKHLGIEVPKAWPAQRTTEEGVISGSLLEWFYETKVELFMHGGVYFKRIIQDFEDKTGKQHNLKDFLMICSTFEKIGLLAPNCHDWFADMMLFDALIGNTDRHQENWGFIIKGKEFYMSPLFDNGTSLGHERFIEHIKDWNDQQITAYVKKGKHHLRYTRNDTGQRIKHFDFLKCLQAHDLDVKQHLVERIQELDAPMMFSEIEDLTNINAKVKFTKERYNWIRTLLCVRIELIKEELK
jgi:hypothetical protein